MNVAYLMNTLYVSRYRFFFVFLLFFFCFFVFQISVSSGTNVTQITGTFFNQLSCPQLVSWRTYAMLLTTESLVIFYVKLRLE